MHVCEVKSAPGTALSQPAGSGCLTGREGHDAHCLCTWGPLGSGSSQTLLSARHGSGGKVRQGPGSRVCSERRRTCASCVGTVTCPAGSWGGMREPGRSSLAWDPEPAVGGSGIGPLRTVVPRAAGGLAGRVREADCVAHSLGPVPSPAHLPRELACRSHRWPSVQCAQALQSCRVSSWPVRSRGAWLWPLCGRRLVAGPLGKGAAGRSAQTVACWP